MAIIRKVRYTALILCVQVIALCIPGHSKDKTIPSAALTGRVSSGEEGPMEGVLVSAKKDGSPITITVVSDTQGRYGFPRNRLEPGQYSVSIRAAGYDLSNPGRVEVTDRKSAQLDLKLVKTKDLAAQLTSSEWIVSAPGTEHKLPLIECTQCHTLERLFRSHYNAAELTKLAQRMGTYYEGSLPERPQLKQPPSGRSILSASDIDYISTVNLSSAPEWQFPLKPFPRPTGKATKVIITQYDLPRKFAMPHDVVPDSQGTVWYSDHGKQFLGRLDPKTGEVAEYPLPVLKPGYPTGLHFLRFDQDGNVWVTMGAQGAIAKFDRNTQKFQIWNMPAGPGHDPNPQAFPLLLPFETVDGKAWVGEFTSQKIERVDLHTGEWDPELIDPFKGLPTKSTFRHTFYDIFSDSQHNVYSTDISGEQIGKMDAKTKALSFYTTPTPNSGPRRGHMDSQDRLWFGENRGNRIGMFDTKTNHFQEWEVPTPFSAPYDVFLDKNGYAWTGGMASDRVSRLDTKTGEIVTYLLPRRTNIRRVEVDNSTNPVSFWTGDNHGASIVKLEPLE